MFTTRFQAWVRRTALRVMARLDRLPLTPNMLTLVGLAITSVAALLVGLDRAFLGGLVLLFAGGFDILDGALARARNTSSKYGAFLDSTSDRYAEVVVMVAVLVYFQRHGSVAGALLTIVALSGSLLVSYVRARAQSLGFTCDGGLLARPERVVLTVGGLLLTPVWPSALLLVIAILAVFTNFTALQRVWIVWQQARPEAREQARAVRQRGRDESRGEAVAPGATEERPRGKSDDREVRPGPEPAGG